MTLPCASNARKPNSVSSLRVSEPGRGPKSVRNPPTFSKTSLRKSHVGAERSFDKFAGLRAKIEDGKGSQRIFAFKREPSGRREGAFRQNTPSRPGPSFLLKNSGEILQPLGVHYHVIIMKARISPRASRMPVLSA